MSEDIKNQSLRVDTTLLNTQQIPKLITPNSPSSPQKSFKSSKSSNSISSSSSSSNNLKKHKNKNKKSSRNPFSHGSPLYGEVSNKMSLFFHAAHNSDKNSNQLKSPDKNRLSTYSTNTITENDMNKENEVEIENDWNDGMFDHFSFEKTSTNNNSNRIVSDPIHSNDIVGLGFSEKKINFSNSLPIGGGSTHKTQITQLETDSKTSLNDKNQPALSSNDNYFNHHKKNLSSESSLESPLNRNSNPLPSYKNPSPMITQNVSRSSSVHSRISTTSANLLQRANSITYSQSSASTSSKTHKRSSSKNSNHDIITTPKSFFKFFSSKKHEPNQPKHHSYSYSQSSDSSQGLSPVISSTANLKFSDLSNSPVSTYSSSSKFQQKNKKRLSLGEGENQEFNNTSLSISTNDTITSKSSPTVRNYSTEINYGQLSPELPLNHPNKSSNESIFSVKTTPNPKRNSIYSNSNFTTNNNPISSQSANATPTATSVPQLTRFSTNTSSTTTPVSNKSRQQSTASVSRTSSISAASVKTTNSSMSANPTTKVRSFVKLGSKSMKYSINNRNKKSSSWDEWDGHSGSFEKIGPVGRKPSPPGQTIPVVTTSNLHSSTNITPLSVSNSVSTITGNNPTTPVVESNSVPLPSELKSVKNDVKELTNEKIIQSDNKLPLLSNKNGSKFVLKEPIPSKGSKNKTTERNIMPLKLPPMNTEGFEKLDKINVSQKFLPKANENTVKILITTNFVDYKLIDISSFPSLSKFMTFVSNMFRIKGEAQFFITEIGLTKDKLGKKLDRKVLQLIWDSISNNSLNISLVFYITADERLKTPDLNSGSPNKNANKVEYLAPPMYHHNDHTEETSLYTTSSYTNSINSDSSFDRYLPTPQHLISVRKDPNVDYWNVKDTIERKPSLKRAPSVTHSSISGDGNTISSISSLSRKTSKLSINSNQATPPSSYAQPNTSASSNLHPTASTSTPPDAYANKLKSSFKVIQPKLPHVDFDNKRSTPFNTSNTLVASRHPPPPPQITTMTPPTPPIPSNITRTSGSVSSSGSTSSGGSNAVPTQTTPSSTAHSLRNTGISRSSRTLKRGQMSIRSLNRSNTQTSVFSNFSSSSGVSVNVDPFSENKISFAKFESDEDSEVTSDEDVDSDCDEFGLFAKKPKSTGSKHSNDSEKSDEKEKATKKDVITVDSKGKQKNSEDEEDEEEDDNTETFGLFVKKPKINKFIVHDTSDEELDDVSDLFHKIPRSIAGTKLNEVVIPNMSKHIFTNNNGSEHVVTDGISATPKNPIDDLDSINKSIETKTNNTTSVVSPTISNDDSLASSLDIRPPAEVLYDNLEVFFPKADLDSLVIDDSSDNKRGIGRMKSIRIIAQEASRRKSYRTPIAAIKESQKLPKSKNQFMNSNSLLHKSNSSLLRRKSTKMWGQKVVEVKLDHKNKTVIPRRVKNGEIEEFAWIKGELIGIGKFGRVYVAMNLTTGDLIAVKQMNINQKFLNEKETDKLVDTFKAEVDSLKDLDHANIVQYLGFEIKDNTYSIFLDYVSGGSIGHLLRKYGRFEESVVRYLTTQALEGLNYIHLKGILHRDLKADNLLLETNGILKISDFGISKRAKDIYTSQSKLNFQGTIFWMAPEIVNDTNGVGYNAKVDIWALGCVVLEMFTGERPWSKYENEGVLYKIGKEKEAPPIKKEIRKEMSREAKDFLKKCFEIEPSRRPTAQTLIINPFCQIDENFEFPTTKLGSMIYRVEEKEKSSLNKRMHSMARKL